MIEIKNSSFRSVVLLIIAVILLFSCSSNTDTRKDIKEEYGEPDFIQKSEFAGLKYEIYVYARKDINKAYEFRKTTSGCGGSSEWYLYSVYYADALGYALYLPPQIKHTPIKSAPPVTVIPIKAEVTDDEQVENVTLHYRVTGQEDFYEISMSGDKNMYSTEIPVEAVTVDGIEYYIEASDGEHTSKLPEEGYYQITVSTAEKNIVEAPSETTSKVILPSLLPQPGDVLSNTSPLSP